MYSVSLIHLGESGTEQGCWPSRAKNATVTRGRAGTKRIKGTDMAGKQYYVHSYSATRPHAVIDME